MSEKRFLVVDDSPTVRKLVRKLAKLCDAETCEASNGLEAITLLEDNPNVFSLILLDINMPELDGLETLDLIKQNAETEDIPVLIVTQESESEKIVQAISAGAAGYIAKPFGSDAFLRKVNSLLALSTCQS
jgi:CheY-like chemotaxis protein